MDKRAKSNDVRECEVHFVSCCIPRLHRQIDLQRFRPGSLGLFAYGMLPLTQWKKSRGRRKKRGKKESSGRARHPAGQRGLAGSKSTVWSPPSRTSTPPRPLAPSLTGPSSGLKGQFMSGKEVSGSPSLLKVTSIQQHLTHCRPSQPATHYGGGWGELEHWKLGMDRHQGKDWDVILSAGRG